MVRPTAEGLVVEDQGSANGTFINDKRVQSGLLRPGDELRLDAVRFVLVAPGFEKAPAPAAAAPARRAPMSAQKMQMWASILLTMAAIALIVLLIRRG